MIAEIKISNASDKVTYIDIEGVIGVPEQWQFDEPGARVATYERFKERIGAIGKINAEKIVVNIRSTGGNVNDALLIHDTLTALQTKIVTRCYGYVASAATIIAQAATQGCREISSNSLYLIHNSVGTVEGNSNEMSQTLDLLGKTDQRIAEIYARRSSKSVEIFTEIMAANNGNGKWMSPKETLDAGLVDKIIEAVPVANNAAKMVQKLGLPDIPKQYKPNAIKNMNNKLAAILEILGVTKQQATIVAENQIDALSDELDAREDEIAQIQSLHETEVATLQNKVKELEAKNARLSAKATKTKPIEDPAAADVKLSPNEEAYSADIQRFK